MVWLKFFVVVLLHHPNPSALEMLEMMKATTTKEEQKRAKA
jgi:hypothetical protein